MAMVEEPNHAVCQQSLRRRPVLAVGIVLAAGAGRRLGRGPKALLTCDGEHLVDRAIAALRHGGCSDIIVVLGADAELVLTEASCAGAECVVNPEWSSGLSSSFRAGVARAESMGIASAVPVVMAVVDQPGLTSALVRRALTHYAPEGIVAPLFDGQMGHPIVMSLATAHIAAAEASGDRGARAYLRAHPELVRYVDCTAVGDGRDVDTPADLHLLGARRDPEQAAAD